MSTAVSDQTEELEELILNLDRVHEEGAFFDVDATGIVLTREIPLETLGVRIPDDVDVPVRAPRIVLLPDTYRLPLIRPGVRAREVLNQYGFRIGVVEAAFGTTAWRWVPWTAFDQTKAGLAACQEELAAAKATLIADYAAVHETVLRSFTHLVDGAANRLAADGIEVPPDYGQRAISAFEDAMPSADEIEERFQIRYRVGRLSLGSEAVAERRRLVAERALLSDAEREAQARARELELVAQERARTITTQERLERERVERRARAQLEMDRLELETMRQTMREHMAPLDEVAAQIQAQVHEAATEMLEAIRKNGFFHGASARAAREMANRFEIVASWRDDAALSALVRQLKEQASAPPVPGKPRDVEPIRDTLQHIVEETWRAVQDLSQPSRAGALRIRR